MFKQYALALALASASYAAERPNILFVMSDDHAAPAISAYSDKLIQTPNIDRLANEGIKFENAFCTNSICTPSRAVVLTGKHSHRNGVFTLSDSFDGSQQTVAKLLQSNGYHTGMIGKWHLKTEPTGFDEYSVLPGQGRYYDPELRHKGDWPKATKHSGYVTDVITDHALKFLDERPADKPFFLMYHHKAPHDVFVPKREHRGLFADPIPEPPNLLEDRRGRPALRDTTEFVGSKHLAFGEPAWRWYLERVHYEAEEIDKWERDLAGLEGDELKRAQYQIYMRRYLQCVYSIDENLGRVLDYLDRENLADNTVVIYTSDQGFFLGEHGLYDKRFMYEETLRIPLLVRAPGRIKRGQTSEALIQNLDFTPTMLDWAGVEIPGEIQGASFRSIAEGQRPSDWRTAIYYRYWMNRAHFNIPAHLGVRTERYKLIYFYDDPRGPDGKALINGAQPNVGERFWELYDLKEDPNEMRNLFRHEAYSHIVGQLKRQLNELRQQAGDAVFPTTASP